MRSKLFIPAARPELFAKALAGDADALSFDLEDSVPADGKAAARARLAEFLAGDAARSTGKTIIVRVNGANTPQFADDVAALAGTPGFINLPKIEDGPELRAAADTIADATPGQRSRLLITIETPRALARAAEIACAHPSVVGLQVGLNDLFAPLGIARRPGHVHAALWAIRMAAGEAGCFAYDGAWPDIDDEEGFRAEAEMARSLGFLGKSCVHPRQVTLANAIFGADATATDRARRIVAAARDAAAAGRGAFMLDGAMIDRPMVARAEALVAGGR